MMHSRDPYLGRRQRPQWLRAERTTTHRPPTWLWLAAALALGLAAATLLLTHPTPSTLTAGAE